MKLIVKQIAVIVGALIALASSCGDCELTFSQTGNNSATFIEAKYVIHTPDCEKAVAQLSDFYWWELEDCLKQDGFDKVLGVGGTAEMWAESLVLDPNNDSTTFVFQQVGELDTLILAYDRRSFYHSKECGYIVEYSGINMQHTTFSKVVIFNQNPLQLFIFLEE